jgi:hypothetical protein
MASRPRLLTITLTCKNGRPMTTDCLACTHSIPRLSVPRMVQFNRKARSLLQCRDFRTEKGGRFR